MVCYSNSSLSRRILIDPIEPAPLEYLGEAPTYCSVATSSESAVKLLPSSTGELASDIQPSDVLVTISLSRLQQYAIDFCAQVIRDSKQLSVGSPDLEHNGPDAELAGKPEIKATTSRNSLAPDLIFRGEVSFSADHLNEFSKRVAKDIWDSVIPCEITMLDLRVDEILDPTDLVGRCHNNLELHRIFISPGENINRAVLDASVLAWHVNKIR